MDLENTIALSVFIGIISVIIYFYVRSEIKKGQRFQKKLDKFDAAIKKSVNNNSLRNGEDVISLYLTVMKTISMPNKRGFTNCQHALNMAKHDTFIDNDLSEENRKIRLSYLDKLIVEINQKGESFDKKRHFTSVPSEERKILEDLAQLGDERQKVIYMNKLEELGQKIIDRDNKQKKYVRRAYNISIAGVLLGGFGIVLSIALR